jgi:hypothetical protein
LRPFGQFLCLHIWHILWSNFTLWHVVTRKNLSKLAFASKYIGSCHFY